MRALCCGLAGGHAGPGAQDARPVAHDRTSDSDSGVYVLAEKAFVEAGLGLEQTFAAGQRVHWVVVAVARWLDAVAAACGQAVQVVRHEPAADVDQMSLAVAAAGAAAVAARFAVGIGLGSRAFLETAAGHGALAADNEREREPGWTRYAGAPEEGFPALAAGAS